MMQWGMNQIAGISAMAKRFLSVEDADLLILLDRLKQLEEAYNHIEQCCNDVCELTSSFSKSFSTVAGDLAAISHTMKDSKEAPQFRAHVEYTQNEYIRTVKAKIDMEAKETLLSEIKEKRHAIDDLKNRISDCGTYCSQYVDMKLQMSHIRDKEDMDPATVESFEKLQTMVHQQKLQLQSDVHFMIEKEIPFIHQSSDIIANMIQRSLSHNASLLEKQPPNYILHPDEPFVEGKEDSEIDFTVAARGYHILPLSIKTNREIIWSVDALGDSIDFRVLVRDEKLHETIIEPMHRISCTQGSYVGVGNGMIELLFDNQYALWRSKKIHVRLGVLDRMEEV